MSENGNIETAHAGADETAILSCGLRILWDLARHTPIDVGTLAARNGLSLRDATRLMTTFEHSGYVRRVPFSELYVLTTMAIGIVNKVAVPTRSLRTPTLQ